MYTDLELEKIAIESIKNYLNVIGKELWTDDYIKSNYSLAIKLIADNYRNMAEINNGISNISSISQGGQSIIFNNNSNLFISEEVKLLLPKPFIRLY
ncbi:hypothetical protein [Clostridium sp.]|jgi:hypothetical protein|uniref:hypothetical protein n=1 Tax=Clostridium sp. TaxID=1506 RepID=UPI002908C7A5|nr:hypothetical protein [Clostridium sp.]MDU7364289.1 hypothetical protein [Clostridium sp.]